MKRKGLFIIHFMGNMYFALQALNPFREPNAEWLYDFTERHPLIK